MVTTSEFRQLARRIVGIGRLLGGTLVDLTPNGITGLVAQRVLEDCGIVVRIGTNSAARREFARDDAIGCAEPIVMVLGSFEVGGERSYLIPPNVRARVAELRARPPGSRLPNQQAG